VPVNSVERFDEVRDRPDLSFCTHDVPEAVAGATDAEPDALASIADETSGSCDFFLRNLNIGVRGGAQRRKRQAATISRFGAFPRQMIPILAEQRP
jgi:hypothetical protein